MKKKNEKKEQNLSKRFGVKEFVICFLCSRCQKEFSKAYLCGGNMNILKASLTNPTCKCGKKNKFIILEIKS